MRSLIGLLFFIVAVFSALLAVSLPVYSLGNHPEASACPPERPYVVFCSHSLHNLEGWVGGCYKSRELAEKEVQAHAKQAHHGNTRWTGVLLTKKKKY